jgi:polyisoprenoid-binding protein YceI
VRALLFTAFLLPGQSLADAAKLPLSRESMDLQTRFDQALSSVQFEVGVLGIFSKSGNFSDFSGSLTLANDGTATVQAVIAAGSVQMKSKADVKTLTGPDYFAAERFPQIRFNSVSFAPALLKTGGQIEGEVELRGVRLRERFEIVHGQCPHKTSAPWRCTFSVSGKIHRSRYGMSARRGIVSDIVVLQFNITPQPTLRAPE